MVDQFSREALFAQAARFRTHPGFQQGKRRHTDIGLEVVEGEPVVAKLVCQTGRYATMLLIMSLAVSRAQRQRAERQLADRLRTETLLADLSALFDGDAR